MRRRSQEFHNDSRFFRRATERMLCIAAVLFVTLASTASPAPSQESTDWAITTGGPGSQRSSPLGQIDRTNVSRLEEVWRWSSPDNRLVAEDSRFKSPRMQPTHHEAGPIKIGDTIYVTTGYSLLAALDATTGETRWEYDPESYTAGRPTNLGFVHRGATFWKDPDDPQDRGRLLYASGDAFLRAVDAWSGEPVGSFGSDGATDLTLGLRREVRRRGYTVTSPVVMCRNVAIVGSSISDGPSRQEAAPGDVRGFDPRTGEQLWTFHSIPQPGEVGHETWEDGSWEIAGNTNVWTLMSVDEELGLAYLPFGTPTNDWYGGHRLGDNLFAESLVAVDCETGERRWHFQAVRHGLWDYDLVTSAILGDFDVGGRRVQAAMQLSKQGFVYVFDRETGEPVWPIEELEVPQTGISGERTAATQPFPTKPPPFERQGFSLDDVVDFTPEIHEAARKIVRQYQYGPLFTPPSERGTIILPGYSGGASWPGGAFDPDTGMLFVPSHTVPVVMTLRRPDPARSNFDYVGSIKSALLTPFGLPVVKPPYSRITAYDMTKGEIAWMHALGDGPIRHPMLRDLDLPPLGSGLRGHVLVTKTLLFVTTGIQVLGTDDTEIEYVDESFDQLDESAMAQQEAEDWRFEQPRIRAYDKRTGELVWTGDLPAHTDGSPITYLHEGRQYITFAIGGLGEPAELIAYALPAD